MVRCQRAEPGSIPGGRIAKMTSTRLKDICIVRFGSDAASRLVPAMETIRHLDFCVATAFNETELSISKSCIYQGKLFKLTDDCEGIYIPDIGGDTVINNKTYSTRLIRNLSYLDISQHLEHKKFSTTWGKTHCFMDNLARYQSSRSEF